MSPLNQHIRRSLLLYPLLFSNRASVLHFMFCQSGNAMIWRDGILVDPTAPTEIDEKKAQAAFFKDLDKLEAQIKKHDEEHPHLPPMNNSVGAKLRLNRARRQFQFDNLDDLAIAAEDPCWTTSVAMRGYSRDHWPVMNVPDDVEPSFRAGAQEVLRHLRECMKADGLEEDPRYKEITQAWQRLITPAQREVAQAMLTALKAPWK